jgi:DNA-binding transcriptional LysR family regulator
MARLRPLRLSLDPLRGFRAAARHLSFTRAAQELNVTQPAISREVKVLEAQLGQPLFRRVNRALQLTQAGLELYRATDEALSLVDATVERVADAGSTLGITTTTAFASLWLAPRLARFAHWQPSVNVRVVSSNDTVDLEREHLDLAIRYVPPWLDAPAGAPLVDYRTFPVCSPAFAREHGHRLRAPADLARHVRVDFETVLYGRPWYDWDQWFDAMNLRPVEPARTLRLSHYDQVVQCAVDGAGIAIGKLPHLARHLRDGRLVAPLGDAWMSRLGAFHVVVARHAAERDFVRAFVDWLTQEVRADATGAARPPPAGRRRGS